MRLKAGFGLAVGALAVVQVTGQTLVGNAGVSGLSTCVIRCSNQVLARFDCTPTQPCYCNNNQLQRDLQDCYQSTGCSFADQVEATNYRASICDIPVRDRRTLLAVVAYVLFGLAGTFTFARLISRWSTFGGAGYSWDDLTAALCLGAASTLTAADYFALRYGKGRDVWGLSEGDVVSSVMWSYIFEIMYVLIVFGTKISLVLLYTRTWNQNSKMRLACWTTIGVLVAAWIAFQVLAVVQCLPIPYQWARFSDSNYSGTCVDQGTAIRAMAGTDIGLNAVVLLLPLPQLMKMKMAWLNKVGICLIYLVGLAVLSMSIMRVVYIHNLTTASNITYDWSYISLYSSIEAYLSQICCCMPAIAGLLHQLWTTASTTFSSLNSQEKVDDIHISAPIATVERHDFGSLSSPKTANADLERGNEHLKHMSSVDSAPAPSIQRASHQPHSLRPQTSFEPITSQRKSLRSSATTTVRHTLPASSSTYRDSGTDAPRAPDILYHDHHNNLKLEIHDPPEEPLKAQLHYIDKNDGIHNLELRGRPRASQIIPPNTTITTRPNTARTSIRPQTAMTAMVRPDTAPSPESESSTYTTTNYSDTSLESSEPDESVASPSAAMGVYPRLSAMGPSGSVLGTKGKGVEGGKEGRPRVEVRSKSEEEKLADLANAHDVLMQGAMI